MHQSSALGGFPFRPKAIAERYTTVPFVDGHTDCVRCHGPCPAEDCAPATDTVYRSGWLCGDCCDILATEETNSEEKDWW